MAPLKFLLISILCCLTYVVGTPVVTPPARNTIFADERLEGEVFVDLDIFNSIELRNEEDNPYRLPNTTHPSHYNIFWNINMDSLNLTGTVQITLYATQENVNAIVLQSSEQNIVSYQLTLGTTIIPVSVSTNPTYEFLIFTLDTGTLQYNANAPVLYTLTIAFSGELRNDMYGIYRSYFRNNATDEPSYMATTQFQATAGRQAFPCYDEPKFKATFSISIGRPQNYSSWSLTRLAQSIPVENSNYYVDVYETTPVMSTYLLAIIVAEYSYLRNPEGANYNYEVIARPAAIEAGQGEYSFDVGQKLLAAMSNHTAIDYYSVSNSLKMTQASIPDFSAGAMENWGLLTYREAYLMYDPEHTNSWNKQIIAYILSHEIAHMWFGNLVTCDWWDSLWLNEGFARYYQYFLTSWVEDYMGFETRFINEQVHVALLTDSANNPHPLTNPGLRNNDDVSNMFSLISYNKGASIIRMTEHLMGTPTHTRGLQKYLRDNSLKTAVPYNLFDALEDVGIEEGVFTEYGSSFSLHDYYASWTDQAGHPVLDVFVDHQTGEMTIVQRRFNINTGYSTANTNYIVPITFATASNPDFNNTKPTHIISGSVSVINRGSVGDEWVVFNKQQTGFYRVKYDDYTMDLIIMALRSVNRTQIHSYNRAQIIDDAFQFARSGLITYDRCFNIISFLENETEYAPWVAAITGFNWIRNRLVGTQYLERINNLFIGWTTNIMNQLTYFPTDGEDFMTSYLRFQLAPVLCNMGVPACREAATVQFRQLVDIGIEVPVDSRTWVYCNALRDGTAADFTFLWQRFNTHPVYTEKLLLLQILGCSPHQIAIYTYLDNIIDDNYVIRPQDYSTAFNSAINGNEANTQMVFTYIQNNVNRFADNEFVSIATPLTTISTRLRTAQQVNEFIQWADQNQAALGTSYTGLVAYAQITLQSLSWVNDVGSQLDAYLEVGNAQVDYTSPSPDTPVGTDLEDQPELNVPETPTLPASAVTTFVSIFTVLIAVVAHVVA